jgi:hypothetical protein
MSDVDSYFSHERFNFKLLLWVTHEPYGAADIASGYGLDDRGVEARVQVGSRAYSTSCRPTLGSTQPPIQWVLAALSPGIKRPGREADHSPPASAEVKKMWIYTSTHPIRLHGVVLN